MITTSYCGWQEEPAILISRLLLRMRRMYVASIRLDLTKNERNAQNALWSRADRPSTPLTLTTSVLTICHVKLTQSTALEQKRLDSVHVQKSAQISSRLFKNEPSEICSHLSEMIFSKTIQAKEKEREKKSEEYERKRREKSEWSH